jgi:PilZ domain
MSNERRITPRKVYTIPVRVRVRTDLFAPAPKRRTDARGDRADAALASDLLEGETVNISELGIYFTSNEHIVFGEELEMFFRLPGELTGRAPENVRCSARVVRVDASVDGRRIAGIGVAIGSFARG